MTKQNVLEIVGSVYEDEYCLGDSYSFLTILISDIYEMKLLKDARMVISMYSGKKYYLTGLEYPEYKDIVTTWNDGLNK